MVFKGLWFILAVVCLFLAAFIDLSKKYILDKNIVKPNELVIYTTISIGLFGLIHLCVDKKCRTPKKLSGKTLLLLFLLGLIGYSFSIAFTHSIKFSPDVSLVGMIISLNIILMYLVSSIFFENSPKINLDVFIALLLIIVGINIIAKKF